LDSQLKRGLLDAYVLKRVSSQDAYGYQLVKDAPPALEISESTLYPILRRLARQGALREYSRAHHGRLRKYYALTAMGRDQLTQFIKDVADIEEVIDYIKRGVQQ
jgi:PadR family transcriptional regulator PadR